MLVCVYMLGFKIINVYCAYYYYYYQMNQFTVIMSLCVSTHTVRERGLRDEQTQVETESGIGATKINFNQQLENDLLHMKLL